MKRYSQSFQKSLETIILVQIMINHRKKDKLKFQLRSQPKSILNEFFSNNKL